VASDQDTANVMSPPSEASASDMPLMAWNEHAARGVTSAAELRQSVHEGYSVGGKPGRRSLTLRKLYLESEGRSFIRSAVRRSGPRSWRKRHSPIATGACIYGSSLRSILLHGGRRAGRDTLLLSRHRADSVFSFLRPALHRAMSGSCAYSVASLSGAKVLPTQRRLLPECSVPRSERGWLDREGGQHVAFGCVAAVLASSYLNIGLDDPNVSDVLSDMQGECKCVLQTTKNWRRSRSGADGWSQLALRSEEEAATRVLAAMDCDEKPKTEKGALEYMRRVRDAAWPVAQLEVVDAWKMRDARSPTISTSSQSSSSWSGPGELE
jgi:hypothetical protein